MRAFCGPAVFSAAARRGVVKTDRQPFKALGSVAGVSATAALALGEVIGDKLPSTPARTNTGPMVARALSGALSGSGVSAAAGQCVAAGALLGSVAAVLSAKAGYELRRRLVQATGLPDPVIALVEDCIAYSGGSAALALVKRAR